MSTVSTPALTVTDAAAKKVHELICDEKTEKLNLRVYVSGGGCSGFRYDFMFDTAINPDDVIVEKKVGDEKNASIIKVLVDSLSIQYLKGAEIDYREDANGSQFVIRNPNAKGTCGCGSSFSV